MSSVSSTLTNIISQTNQINHQNNLKTMGTSALNPTAFLQLLTAQLTNQDPLNPTDNNQMLQQEASLSQVQSLNTLQNVTSLSSASGLIGKTVTLTPTDTKGNQSGKPLSGLVTGASYSNGVASVIINGVSHPISDITNITGAQTTASNTTGGK